MSGTILAIILGGTFVITAVIVIIALLSKDEPIAVTAKAEITNTQPIQVDVLYVPVKEPVEEEPVEDAGEIEEPVTEEPVEDDGEAEESFEEAEEPEAEESFEEAEEPEAENGESIPKGQFDTVAPPDLEAYMAAEQDVKNATAETKK